MNGLDFIGGGWLGFLLALIVSAVLAVMLIKKTRNAGKQKTEYDALKEKTQIDELTGVYNRSSFLDKAQEMIEGSGDDIYIVRFNVCRFKMVNEMYGAEKGDHLLCEMGRDLKAMGRQMGFIVGRFTADHFYMCARRKDFERIELPHRAPAPWLGIDITMCYGVYPVGSQKDIPVSAMCDRADMAIASGDNSALEHIFYYSDSARQKMLHEQEIENDMVQAISERQFCIYIQPKFDIETEDIVGGEALVRWIHPQRGMVPPGAFIGLFERNGFIRELDYYVWEECCRFLAEAKKKGLPVLPLSMNVSRIHFYGSELVEKLMDLVEKYEIEPGELELEITEGICANDTDIIFNKCEELRGKGFKISMDDFGSGYSSLNMLKEMPLDIIKMDLRFLSGDVDAEQKVKGQHILRTLIELAHTLGLGVVVEGLETAEQKEFIKAIGRSVVQGYYYSKPVDCRSYESMIGGE